MTSNRLGGGRRTFSRGGRISSTANTISRIPNAGTISASQCKSEVTTATSVKTVHEDPSNPRMSPQMVRMVAAESSKRQAAVGVFRLKGWVDLVLTFTTCPIRKRQNKLLHIRRRIPQAALGSSIQVG